MQVSFPTHVHVYVQKSFYTCVYTPICAGSVSYMCRQCSYTCIRVSSVPTHVYVQEVFLNIFILAGRIPAHDVQEMFLLHVHVYMCRKCSCMCICVGNGVSFFSFTHVHVYVHKVSFQYSMLFPLDI